MKRTKIIKYFVLLMVLVVVFTLTTTVLAEKSTEFTLADPCQDFDPLPGHEDATIYCGELKGAGYRVEVPANWNGDLFVWAHGLRPNPAILFVENPPIREWLVQNGYAWAASSFSANHFDVSTGIKDTLALTQFFNGLVSVPEHTYLAGQSMGGAIVVNAIEQYPNVYDAALPVCGSLISYENVDYLFDYYVISNALAGNDAAFPIPPDYSTTIYPSVKSELELFPGTFPFTLNAKGQQLKNAIEILGGGDRPTFDQAFLFWYGLAALFPGQLPGNFLIDAGTFSPGGLLTIPGVNGNFIDNTDSIYQFDFDPNLSPEEEAFNQIVLRLEADPQARHPNGLKNIPVPNGNITIPVLTIHSIGDLFVPLSMEQMYAQKVAAQGKSDFLVQRGVREFLHCGVTPDEIMTGFADLVQWVENGVKPLGDDILDPAVVSDPYFGCDFTSPERVYPPPISIPPCP